MYFFARVNVKLFHEDYSKFVNKHVKHVSKRLCAVYKNSLNFCQVCLPYTRYVFQLVIFQKDINMDENRNYDPPDNFVLQESLEQIDKLKESMKSFLKKYSQLKKIKPKFDEVEFKRNLKPIKIKWFSTLESVFYMLKDMTLNNRIASDFMRELGAANRQYKTDENVYRLILECATIPIIALIMDEQELTKESSERQERRKRFIEHLVDFRLPQEKTIEVINIDDSGDSVDILPAMVVDDYRFESAFVLGFLIEALNRHSKMIAPLDADFFAQIYHIINVTHIVDIINKYLVDLRECAAKQCKNSVQNAWDFETKPRLMKELEKFEITIGDNKQLFEFDHPQAIFRHDLVTIEIEIRLLQSVLSRKVEN